MTLKTRGLQMTQQASNYVTYQILSTPETSVSGRIRRTRTFKVRTIILDPTREPSTDLADTQAGREQVNKEKSTPVASHLITPPASSTQRTGTLSPPGVSPITLTSRGKADSKILKATVVRPIDPLLGRSAPIAKDNVARQVHNTWT